MLNLVLVGGYLDVALRDLGLCLAAVSLALLAQAEERVGGTGEGVASDDGDIRERKRASDERTRVRTRWQTTTSSGASWAARSVSSRS